MIQKYRIVLLFYFIALVRVATITAQEVILSFYSDVTVVQDGSLLVSETITIRSTGKTIKRGIVREFPTRYSSPTGTHYVVDFAVQSVLRDGAVEQYQVQRESNGYEVYIGNRNGYLKPGIYTYKLTYTTNRQIGFFEDHDELYWNVTGNGWNFPIEKVAVHVHLPDTIPASSIITEGYIGYSGQRGKEYTSAIRGTDVTIIGTRPLHKKEGLTVVVGWPKGFIKEPSLWQKIYWFFRDNGILLWVFFWFCILVCWYVYWALRAKKANKPGIVIPLFYPPAGMAPSAIGFINNKGQCYSSMWNRSNEPLLAPDIVNLAVQGCITIQYDEKTAAYSLIAKKQVATIVEENTLLSTYDKKLLTILFSSTDTVVLGKNNNIKIEKTAQFVDKFCESTYKKYVKNWWQAIVGSYIIEGAAVLPFFYFFAPYTLGLELLYLVIIIFSFANMTVIWFFVRAYTTEGRKLQDEIDGFKLFLETTETERMKIIGTPPTKTPELYEKYLPYAMALGVEEQWTRQFTPLFESFAREGHSYVPLWYYGRPFSIRTFASGLHHSLNKSISSAVSRPGGSSGFGGKGSSGSGGGGGGGRGW